MRSLRVRERDRLPEDYPTIRDWVAPVGAQAKLNPNSRISGMTLSTSNDKKDKDFEAMMRAIDGRLIFETTLTKHSKTRGVFDGYDKKKKVIERETELAGPDAILQNEMFAEGVDAVPASPASFPSGRSRGMTYNPSSQEIIDPGPLQKTIFFSQYSFDAVNLNCLQTADSWGSIMRSSATAFLCNRLGLWRIPSRKFYYTLAGIGKNVLELIRSLHLPQRCRCCTSCTNGVNPGDLFCRCRSGIHNVRTSQRLTYSRSLLFPDGRIWWHGLPSPRPGDR